jgi:hypothetical protein
MDVDRTTSKWKVVINPQEYEIEDILNGFFNTTTERGGGSQKIRQFKAQEIALEHCDEEQETQVGSNVTT